ncbi:hypothetical protein SAMN05444008_10195 [Cnuella takakiae]|uniref:Uncharacterized protein n=1 Tax=Cnuella takakiae TaxID=1302690 RepID=A0A1M4SES8_9BACT|nr:hypothetical protein [Cnuella takakiae]OLY94480.1 hypothetical protein BUE76_23335 [Cnuella takakiae]SHE30517.1 hypothetical protein SAMN05444008_10195 [Cnuella takakiae]
MSWLNGVLDRIDVTSIYKNHLTTFYHYEKQQFYGKKEMPISDKLLFGILPLVIAVLLSWGGLRFNKDYVDIILTCLSIFIGLLFGLLTMVYSQVQENQKINGSNINPEDIKRVKAKIDLTIHLFINIAFSIVLSIFALILVLLTQFRPERLIDFFKEKSYFLDLKSTYLYVSNGVSFFLLIEFVLVLLMIIRRFMVLFLNQMSITGPKLYFENRE